mgnify:CR=1 FL=1
MNGTIFMEAISWKLTSDSLEETAKKCQQRANTVNPFTPVPRIYSKKEFCQEGVWGFPQQGSVGFQEMPPVYKPYRHGMWHLPYHSTVIQLLLYPFFY